MKQITLSRCTSRSTHEDRWKLALNLSGSYC